MSAPWFRPGALPLDSNQHWRSGCPHEELARGEFEWLQLLTHPEIWAYDGATMGETMRVVPRRRPRGGLEQLAATGSTSREADHRPRHRLGRARHGGAAARAARERRARGAARRHRHERALGRPAPLRRVPPRSGRLRPGFADAMPRDRRARGRRRGAAAVVVRPRGARRRTASASTDRRCSSRSPDAIRRSNDKAETYAFLHRLGLPAPDFRRVRGAAEVEAAARELGYPERPVCFKPVFSSGSRGFRILDPTVDRAAPAARRAARLGVDAARGGGRDPAGRRRDRAARDGARDRRRADDRRDRERPRDRARPPEDARGDARRARDVLRHARRRRR